MIIAIDFETYYSQEYSLSKMTETEYVLDPRFEIIMCAVKLGDAPSSVYVGAERVTECLAAVDWSRAAMLSHNCRFDGAILAWRYGHIPAFYLDTLSMARGMTHAVTGSSSLKSVARYLKLGVKGDEVVQARGKRLADFAPDELANYGSYCRNDNELCRAIFDKLRPKFPTRELALVDMNLRMFIEPQTHLNPSRLKAHRTVVRVSKQLVMDKVAYIADPSVFSSTAKFTALLESYGVDIPMKPSPADPSKMIPAMAKGDVAFKEMVDDPNQLPEVQALLAARVGSKSTIDETRAETLLRLSKLGTGAFPVPLKYYGAHTGRFSGDGGYNAQNLRRGGQLKKAIQAPPGWALVHRDASQIEARMVAWLANCGSLLDAFMAGRDVYCEFGSGVYRREITKANASERFCAKTAILSLQYAVGPARLRKALFIGDGRTSVSVDEEQAKSFVNYYRQRYNEVPMLWRHCDAVLLQMVADTNRVGAHGARRALQQTYPITVPAITSGRDALWLPNGMPIAYPALDWVEDPVTMERQFTYRGPRGEPRKIYGGKVTENVSQALARIVVTDIMFRVKQETGFRPFLMTHDSLDYCVPEEQAAWWHSYLHDQFAVRPTCAQTLPLASEGGYGRTLAEAERARSDT